MHWLKRVNLCQIIIRAVIFIGGISLYFPVLSQESSVLSSGKWYKLAITQTGVHKIDVNLLKKMGIDITSLNPAQIQVYGNGGSMLPQKNTAFKNKDLIQNAI